MREIWKQIDGFGNKYKISNKGRVMSLHNNKSVILKGRMSSGYYRVALQYHKYRKQVLIHRLVAEAFIPNPDNLPQVNHKDENKLNNNVNNLEWCTNKYNQHYGTCNERRIKSLKQHKISDITKARQRHPKGMTWKEYEMRGGIIHVD